MSPNFYIANDSVPANMLQPSVGWDTCVLIAIQRHELRAGKRWEQILRDLMHHMPEVTAWVVTAGAFTAGPTL